MHVVREPAKVIMDSNALFVPSQCRIDVFAETRTVIAEKF